MCPSVPVPLIPVSVLPILHKTDFFRVSLKIKQREFSNFILFFQNSFSYSSYFDFLYKFQNQLVTFYTKKSCQNKFGLRLH